MLLPFRWSNGWWQPKNNNWMDESVCVREKMKLFLEPCITINDMRYFPVASATRTWSTNFCCRWIWPSVHKWNYSNSQSWNLVTKFSTKRTNIQTLMMCIAIFRSVSLKRCVRACACFFQFAPLLSYPLNCYETNSKDIRYCVKGHFLNQFCSNSINRKKWRNSSRSINFCFQLN